MMTDFEQLTAWIQPQHLSAEGVNNHREMFAAHTAQVLHIVDFLRSDVCLKIGQFLSREAIYQPTYGLYSAKDHAVSADIWCAADEQDRFFNYGMLGDTASPHRFSPNLFTFMRLRQLLTTTVFKRYVSAITGLPLGDAMPTKVHQLRQGHFLKSHDDTDHARRLAFIFYLSPGWSPDYGGALHIVGQDGKLTTVEAIFNSFAVFDVTKHQYHYISDIQHGAGNQARLTIGGWFRNPTSEWNQFPPPICEQAQPVSRSRWPRR